MAWKNLKQSSFADQLLIDHKALQELDDINALINWSQVESLFSKVHKSPRGEKAWPPLLMFKALLLQVWYRLGDEQLEKQLARDLLFKRFVGLPLDQSVPDHSSLWRFRKILSERNLFEKAFKLINDQLKDAGLILQLGEASIIDASVVEAHQSRKKPSSKGKDTRDPEASSTCKAGSDGRVNTTYGFKAHINVDEDGFVKTSDFTTASPHDSNVFESLLTGTEQSVYADSAYKSKKHDKLLDALGIDNAVLKKGYRNRPLTTLEKHWNQIRSGTRSIVESVFGIMKLHYGLRKARYLGIERNKARFTMMCIAYNLKRAVNVLKI